MKQQVCRCGENLAQQAGQGNSRFWISFPENQGKLGMEKPGKETTVSFATTSAFQHNQTNKKEAEIQRMAQLHKGMKGSMELEKNGK